MYIEYKGILAIVILSFIVGCQEGSSLKESDSNPVHYTEMYLGQEYLDQVNNADRVTLSRVSHSSLTEYVLEDNTVELDKEDISKLKDILLSDESYLFDVRKKCVFVPDYAVEIYVNNRKLLLLYAPLCKEFKVPYGNFKEQVIEVDPSFEKIERLLNKYKKQLEVNDGNNTSFNG